MIQKAAVLGAGTMGSRIAAHLANAGIPVLLLDLPGASDRALTALRSAKPPALYDESLIDLIGPGQFDTDLPAIGSCDWIIEAVAEDLAIKRSLLGRVAEFRRHDAIVTTNTSGLPVEQIALGFSSEFQRHWFGVHFFNPPRYMRLVEVIPTPTTDRDLVSSLSAFITDRLGKTVVVANDTPNFIANRIGIFALFNAVRLMQQLDLTIESVDALTGPALGWPNTATFRLMDLIGIDVLTSMGRNFAERVHDERRDVALPEILPAMVQRGLLGNKSGAGFYRRADGFVLDWKTLEHRAPTAPQPSSAFEWRMRSELWNYAAHRIGEISDDVADIDRAMEAGFNWERGPFAMWDAAGFVSTLARMKDGGEAIAPAAQELAASGRTSWRELDGAPAIVRENNAASLIDLGDDVVCIQLHTKMNAIGDGVLSFVTETLRSESGRIRAFVIGGSGTHFSAGANLAEILDHIENHRWADLALFIKRFQDMTQAVRFCRVPVVAAAYGLCLGGGAEVVLHARARQVHAELSMGLVEAGVGLIPGGGGCKQLALRAIDGVNTWTEVFELLTSGARSQSAAQARSMHLLLPEDRTSMNRDRLLGDAKQLALELKPESVRLRAVPAPSSFVRSTLESVVEAKLAKQSITEYDAVIARKIIQVLCAGNAEPGTLVTEDHFLDAERDAFLSLCREPKTAERIAYTLKTGKPLRN